jgi:hypothetical protein
VKYFDKAAVLNFIQKSKAEFFKLQHLLKILTDLFFTRCKFVPIAYSANQRYEKVKRRSVKMNNEIDTSRTDVLSLCTSEVTEKEKENAKQGDEFFVNKLLTFSCRVQVRQAFGLLLFVVMSLLPPHCRCRVSLLHLTAHTDTQTHTQSVGLDWTRGRPFSKTSTSTTHNTYKRQTSTQLRDSNPQSQQTMRRQTDVLGGVATVTGKIVTDPALDYLW